MRAMSEPAELSGRELLDAALRGGVAPPPYIRLLGMRFTAVADGSATFEMPASGDHYNPNNVVHGGAITSLADSAMGFAVFSTCAAGETFTTAELHVNFLKPLTVESGMLRSIGRVVHRGQQVVVADADVFDQRDQLVARASSTNFILHRRPPVQPQALMPPEEPAAYQPVTPAAATALPPVIAPVAPVAPAPFSAPPSPLERSAPPMVSP